MHAPKTVSEISKSTKLYEKNIKLFSKKFDYSWEYFNLKNVLSF